MIQEQKKDKNVSVMIWTAFWGAEQSDIYGLKQDFETKKQGYTVNSYIQILKDNLLEIWESGLIFMHDNALIHTARKVTAWLEEHSIEIMKHPSYSSDLNSIEHLWFWLKELIYQVRPDIEQVDENDDKVREELLRALQEAWPMVAREYMDSLIMSMDMRVNAILLSKRWYTRF